MRAILGSYLQDDTFSCTTKKIFEVKGQLIMEPNCWRNTVLVFLMGGHPAEAVLGNLCPYRFIELFLPSSLTIGIWVGAVESIIQQELDRYRYQSAIYLHETLCPSVLDSVAPNPPLSLWFCLEEPQSWKPLLWARKLN